MSFNSFVKYLDLDVIIDRILANEDIDTLTYIYNSLPEQKKIENIVLYYYGQKGVIEPNNYPITIKMALDKDLQKLYNYGKYTCPNIVNLHKYLNESFDDYLSILEKWTVSVDVLLVIYHKQRFDIIPKLNSKKEFYIFQRTYGYTHQHTDWFSKIAEVNNF
jgi:hypothetical protein